MSTDTGGFGARLLLVLASRGLIDSMAADSALSEANKRDVLVEQVLLEREIVDRTQLTDALAGSYDMLPFHLERDPIDPEAACAIPPAMAQEHQAMGVGFAQGRLVVVTASPGSDPVRKQLEQATGRSLTFVVADRVSIREALASRSPAPVAAGSARPLAPPPAPAAPPPRKLLGGRYAVGDELMVCRFSTLYRAEDLVSGQPLVLRKLEGSYSFLRGDGDQAPVQREARLQILREGRTLSRLRHRNLPRVRGIFEQGSDIYLVLDDIPGKTLEGFVGSVSQPLAWELLRRFLSQFLSVLGYLHDSQPRIVHRDLRPDTVLVTPHGVIKVAEFGLAKMLEGESEGGKTSFRSQGDPRFAAPEQLIGEPSHPRHDLYSVGALLYFLAGGQPPPESLKMLYGGEKLRPLVELRPDCPPDLQSLVQQLLDTDPEKRPESAAAAGDLVTEKERPMSLPGLLLELVRDGTDPPPLEPPPVEETQPQRVQPALEGLGARVARKLSMWQLLFGGGKHRPPEAAGAPQPSDDFAKDYGQQFPRVNLEEIPIDRELARTLSEAVARAIQGVCIGKLGPDRISVACKDPTDVHIYDTISVGTRGLYKANLVKAEPHMADLALEYVYRAEHLTDPSWFKFLEQKRLDEEVLETLSQGVELSFGDEALAGPVVEAVDRLIKEAIAAGASDIHLEPFEVGMDVRYRVDGVLRKVNAFPPDQAGSIVKRIKVLGNLDIAQERTTQGGRISLRIGPREYDLRVSVVPVPAGESVVMRILKKGAFTLTLSDLGFAEETEGHFRTILSQPYGMILVCGPTGSGKSTTLYASLKEIQRPDRKLLTVEDPIEYQMPGIIQVQVNNAPREQEKRVTFSRALREFLRQDPDVILVGEIRDQETAEIAIQAALTGHLLLSTIHTNDSVGIVARLRDMQCEPFLIGSVLLGGLAQRLARRICPDCRQQVEVPAEFRELFEQHGIAQPRMFRGVGCRTCHGIGTRGRIGLYELLEVTPEIRALVNRGAQEEEIRRMAESQGFRNLLHDGVQKVHSGMVSLEEVLRVCKTV